MEDLGRLEATLGIGGFVEAVCSCGSPEIVGRCLYCAELRCGSCAVAAGREGVVCDGCRWPGPVGI
jgi:hypothetical protein